MSLDNTKFYKSAFKKHGVSAHGVNWNSLESQSVRFEVLTNLLDKEICLSTIADAGCGFGDLFVYWLGVGVSPVRYVGIDCIGDFVDIASSRVPDQNASFVCKDILKDDLPHADWYVASGSLNILKPFDTWIFLEKMLKYSKKGIVFNILKGYKKSKNFNYQTKESMEEFAQRKSLDLLIVEGYLKNDMSIRMKR